MVLDYAFKAGKQGEDVGITRRLRVLHASIATSQHTDNVQHLRAS